MREREKQGEAYRRTDREKEKERERDVDMQNSRHLDDGKVNTPPPPPRTPPVCDRPERAVIPISTEGLNDFITSKSGVPSATNGLHQARSLSVTFAARKFLSPWVPS